MKLNKKGFTLIELIVSITLISVIMVFMFSLLSDVTFEKDNEYFASKNQEIRLEMINIISKAARYNYDIDDTKDYVNPLKNFSFGTKKLHDSTNMTSTVQTFTSNDSETKITFGDGNTNHEHELVIDKSKNQIRFHSDKIDEYNEDYKYAWTLKQGHIHNTTCKTIKAGSIGLIECTIKVFTDNDNNTEIETTNKAGSQIKIDNNNSLDDIVLDFMVNLA